MFSRTAPFFFTFYLLCVVLPWAMEAQTVFPIKQNKKWGLMNAEGYLVRPAVYDAIGEFKNFGYAVMQRQGRVGLLSKTGKEVVAPKYEDLKVLDSLFLAVMANGRWKVIDMEGRLVLPPGYDQVKVLRKGSWRAIIFSKNGLWGLVSASGALLAEPQFDELKVLEAQPEGMTGTYILTRQNERFGLLNASGNIILKPLASEIRPYNDFLFFAKRNQRWSAFDHTGTEILEARYQYFSKLSDNYLKLVSDGKTALFSLLYYKVVAEGQHDNYYPFSDEYALCRKNSRMGLIDHCGKTVLSAHYEEIQTFNGEIFRVKMHNRWGLVSHNDELILPFQYDYISPLKGKVAVVIANGLRGAVNAYGYKIVEPLFDKLEIKDREIRALANGQLTIFHLDNRGYLDDENAFGNFFSISVVPQGSGPWMPAGNQHPYQLDKFEWFFSTKNNKWGLRRLDNGAEQIQPSFDEVHVLKDIGLTLVGVELSQPLVFDRTNFRCEMTYGLVQNDTGLLVHEVDIVDIRLHDFSKGLPAARCIFSDGRQGLVNKIGKVLLKDFAYIGEYHDGLARASAKGRLSAVPPPAAQNLGLLKDYLSAHMAPITLTDYTQYDLDLEARGLLVCQDCQWGYIDTLGIFRVAPQYSFALDFVNEVGIVAQDEKWGMVNKTGKEVLPCRFDELGFMENTGNRVLRIFKKEHKYGLIDSLGRLAVSAQYEAIGSFTEGRLAVKRNNHWGFVDRNGLEVVPCRFDEVAQFSEGLAAVRIGSKWGYIDKNGHEELPFVFSKAGRFGNGLAPAKKAGPCYGYINRSGQWAIQPQYPMAHAFDRGVAIVEKHTGEYLRAGLIDTSGNYISKPRFLSIADFDAHGLAVVALGGFPTKYALLNLRGELITSDPFRFIGEFHEGLARVQLGDRFGFINTAGRLVIKAEFQKASDFSEGKAAVWMDGRCGFIDRSGNIVIDPVFSRCMDFQDGKAIVFKGGRKAGLIDHQGAFVIQPEVNRLIDFNEGRGLVRDEKYQFYYITEQNRFYDGFYEKASRFRYGMAVVKVDGRWAVINQQGIEIIPPKYDRIEQFEDGFAKVRIRGFNGVTNLRGELILQPDYEYISYAGEGLFRVEQGDKLGYFDLNGHWVWGLQE